MRYLRWCIVVAVLFLDLSAGPALANDAEICATATGKAAIAACDRLIASTKGRNKGGAARCRLILEATLELR